MTSLQRRKIKGAARGIDGGDGGGCGARVSFSRRRIDDLNHREYSARIVYNPQNTPLCLLREIQRDGEEVCGESADETGEEKDR